MIDELELIDKRIQERKEKERKKAEAAQEKEKKYKEKRNKTKERKEFKASRGIDPSKKVMSDLEKNPDSTLLAEINGLPHGGQNIVPEEERWVYFGGEGRRPWKFYMQQYRLAKEIIGEEKFPLYDRLVCSMCGTHIAERANRRGSGDNGFYNSGALITVNRNYGKGAPKMVVCQHCVNKLYRYFLKEYGKDHEREATERFCAEINLYFDWEIFCKAIETDKKVCPESLCPMGQYVDILDKKGLNLPFFFSPHIQALLKGNKMDEDIDPRSAREKERYKIVERAIIAEAEEGNINTNPKTISDSDLEAIANRVLDSLGRKDYDMTPYFEWAKDERLARQRIIKIYKYDPFGDEADLEAKKKMYRDLELMLDENMETNSIKLNAAVSIVRAYKDIRRYEKFIEDLEQSKNPDIKQIKSMQEILNYKRDTVLKMAKENGFNADGKTSGQNKNTLSGRMAEMRKYMYEPGLVDFYGVRTVKSFQEISDISFKSIMDQIGLTEGEWKDMITDQAKTIRKQNDDIVKLKEELRQAYIEIERNKLLKEEKEEEKQEW